MQPHSQYFHSKLLVFGEYSLLLQSRALTVPFRKYTATLRFPEKTEKSGWEKGAESNHQLTLFHNFLTQLSPALHGEMKLDLKTFRKEIEKGLFLDSDIPEGFGLGSSGALVAAVYARYSSATRGESPPAPEYLARLKSIFSAMESFFHGNSSGIDPLSAYLDRPLLQDEYGGIIPIQPTIRENDSTGFFIVNTGKARKTAPLVRVFNEKGKIPAFRQMMQKDYIPANNACIEATLQGSPQALFQNLEKLSSLQFSFFREMIPLGFEEIWEKGLEGKTFLLKLCGAGGGGLLLGYTPDPEETAAFLKKHSLRAEPFNLP